MISVKSTPPLSGLMRAILFKSFLSIDPTPVFSPTEFLSAIIDAAISASTSDILPIASELSTHKGRSSRVFKVSLISVKAALSSSSLMLSSFVLTSATAVLTSETFEYTSSILLLKSDMFVLTSEILLLTSAMFVFTSPTSETIRESDSRVDFRSDSLIPTSFPSSF